VDDDLAHFRPPILRRRTKVRVVRGPNCTKFGGGQGTIIGDHRVCFRFLYRTPFRIGVSSKASGGEPNFALPL